METTVKIKWDKPEEANWLCPENIEIALSSYCKNTEFEVEEVNTRQPQELTDEMINIKSEYWDAKQVLKNPQDYHEQTVIDAQNFCNGYELAKSEQPKGKISDEESKQPDRGIEQLIKNRIEDAATFQGYEALTQLKNKLKK